MYVCMYVNGTTTVILLPKVKLITQSYTIVKKKNKLNCYIITCMYLIIEKTNDYAKSVCHLYSTYIYIHTYNSLFETISEYYGWSQYMPSMHG